MDRRELVRVAGLCALAFLILASYAIARPATESLFLAVHGSGRLPWVWLAVAATATVTVALYRRACARISLPAMLTWALVVGGAVLVALLGLRRVWAPGATFLLYCWKDVYVVVLVEIFWSIANATFELGTARWAYGLFCAAGSLGGAGAGWAVGALSHAVGTASALWAVLPVLAAAGLVGARVTRGWALPTPAPAPAASAPAIRAPWSPYILLLVALIGVVQVVITLVDYEFNVTIEAALPDMDARTAAIGRIYSTIDVCSMVLQLGTGAILKYLGVRATLLAIPVLLGLAVSAFVAAPRVATIAIAKVASKAFDYSLFRAAKEILYLPLSYAEKTQGKALVDVWTYRVSKAGASLLLLGLASVAAPLAVSLILLWIVLAAAVTRRSTSHAGR